MTNILTINSDDKKSKYKVDYYILHTVFYVTILLFLITFICFYR